jgi:hypothetical protein
MMDIATRWTVLRAPFGRAAFASRLRGKCHDEKQAHKTELLEWGNEGRYLAPPPQVPNAG